MLVIKTKLNQTEKSSSEFTDKQQSAPVYKFPFCLSSVDKVPFVSSV